MGALMSESYTTVGREGAIPIRPADRGRAWWPHLWALLGYFALALVVTYPATAHFTSQVPGDLIADRDQNLWNLWWLLRALTHPTNPLHTDMLYYPYGANLYYHTLGVPQGLIGLLPQDIWG